MKKIIFLLFALLSFNVSFNADAQLITKPEQLRGPVDLNPVAAYMVKQNSLGSTLTDREATAIYYLYTDLVQARLWNKTLFFHPFFGSNVNGFMEAFKTLPGKSKTLTAGGVTPLTIANKIDTLGYRNTGAASQWIKTDFSPSDIGNTAGFGVFASEAKNPIGTTIMIGGDEIGIPTSCLYNSTGATGFAFRSSGVQVTRTAVPKGFIYAQKSGPTDMFIYENKQLSAKDATLKVPVASSTKMCIGASFIGNARYDKALAYVIITDGTLSYNEIDVLTDILFKFVITCGRHKIDANPLIVNSIYGQSLAIATVSGAALTTTQPYSNLRWGYALPGTNFSTGNVSYGGLNPLIEAGAESSVSGLANQFSSKVRANQGAITKYDFVGGAWGLGGAAYSALAKNTSPYNNIMIWLKMLKQSALLFYPSIQMDGVFILHGETDVNSTTYGTDIATWQNDFDTDVKAITGQTNTVQLYFSQPSGWTTGALKQTTSKASIAMYTVAKTNPNIILVDAKYDEPNYFSDGVHLINLGYRRQGEKFGVAYYINKFSGSKYKPCQPVSVSRAGATIDVLMNVPDGQLVFDVVNVTDPGNYGFEYTDNSGSPPTISSVTILADYNAVAKTQTVRIVLSGIPTGTKFIRYAYTGILNNIGGPTTGPRGCLKSPNTLETSLYTNNLDNWCVHFEEAVSYNLNNDLQDYQLAA